MESFYTHQSIFSPASKQANRNIFKNLFLSGEGWLSVNWTLRFILVRTHTFTPAQNEQSVTAEQRGAEENGRVFIHLLRPGLRSKHRERIDSRTFTASLPTAQNEPR